MGEVATNLVERINAEHRACENAAASAVEHAMNCGDYLEEAKAQAGHGNWLTWLAENFEGSQKTANTYMRLADNREEINQKRASNLSIRGALRELSAPEQDPLPEEAEQPSLEELESKVESSLEEAHAAEQQLDALLEDAREQMSPEDHAKVSQHYKDRMQAVKDYALAEVLEPEVSSTTSVVSEEPYTEEDVAEMGPIGPKPASESQARPLTKIEDPEERSQVWEEVNEEAKSEGEPATTKRVESKVNQHLEQSHGVRDLGPQESQTTEEVEDVDDTEEPAANIVPRIVRAATMEYVVDFYDGYPPRTTHRNVLLEEDYKKCECCKGYGIVERHQQ